MTYIYISTFDVNRWKTVRNSTKDESHEPLCPSPDCDSEAFPSVI
jgi:hypothetical protein